MKDYLLIYILILFQIFVKLFSPLHIDYFFYNLKFRHYNNRNAKLR